LSIVLPPWLRPLIKEFRLLICLHLVFLLSIARNQIAYLLQPRYFLAGHAADWPLPNEMLSTERFFFIFGELQAVENVTQIN